MGDNYGIAGRIIESISAKDAEIERLRVALRELIGACQRYDEEPSSLNLAGYEAARDHADAALAGGKDHA